MKHSFKWLVVAMMAAMAGIASASCGVLVPIGERPTTLDTHTCCSFCLGKRTFEAPNKVTYYGLTLGFVHASMSKNDVMRMFCDEQCNFRGASVQLFSQLNGGRVDGLSASGLVTFQEDVRGIQLSGLANDTSTLKGAQVALGINLATKEATGVQVGILNIAEELKGVQIGLINVNRAGWVFPLINFSW